MPSVIVAGALVVGLVLAGLSAVHAAGTRLSPEGAGASLMREAEDGQGGAGVYAAGALRTVAYLPLVEKSQASSPLNSPLSCQPVTGEAYGILDVVPPSTDRPAEQHGDLNLELRGYWSTTYYKGLVTYGGSSDSAAPQLAGLFVDNRTPVFSAVYRVYDWDWTCNCRGSLIASWPVTLAGMAVSPGEVIRVPESGYAIGSGYEVLVLYASATRITLKYTRTDNVVNGYTLHLENICVDPNLLSLYQSWNAGGRSYLPALRAGQPIGYATGSELGVAIRDTGAFMDPRSRNDWWLGR